MANIKEGILAVIYGLGGILFFAGFMYIMVKWLVEVFKDKE